jgi:FAD/FMN-containing dehydrogenase
VEWAGTGSPPPSLEAALGSRDAVAASDASGRARLWRYRDEVSLAIGRTGVPHKLDVTLPIAQLAEFCRIVPGTVRSVAPKATVHLFGHLGDGNLHVNVVGPSPDDERVDEAVLSLVASMGGSISAEHGIGRAKARWLHLCRTDEELRAMRAIKDALDPQGLLNPGVLFA